MISSFKDKYRFLSNFWPSPFTYDGILYPTNEHFFQAMKTNDKAQRRLISEARTPGLAKWMGRQTVLRIDWPQINLNVMLYGLRKKFQNKELAAELAATFPHTLVEGNWWHDNLWGNCYCQKCKGIEGQNLLGLSLEQIRLEILTEGR